MCGLFGVVSYGHSSSIAVNKLIKALGKASETRGTDAGGVSYINEKDGRLVIRRNKGAISKNGVFEKPINGRVIMGHTRLGTGASEKFDYNNHPFPSTIKPYAMAHNGVLGNDVELELENNLPDTKVETDSYVVVRLLDHLYDGVLNLENIRSVAEMLEGTFNLTFHDSNGIWIVKHNNPLYILDVHELQMIIYASTKDIVFNALNDFYDKDFIDFLLGRAGDSYALPMTPTSGDIVYIANNGLITTNKFKPKPYTYKSTYVGGYRPYGFDYPTENGYEKWWEDESGAEAKYDEMYDEEFYQRSMQSLYDMHNSKGINKGLIELYGGSNYLPKSDRYFIYNGVDFEVTMPPYTFSGVRSVYSDLLGRTIEIDTENAKAMTLSIHKAELFKTPFKKSDFSDIIDNNQYGLFMQGMQNNETFNLIMTNVKNSAYPKEAKQLLKNLIALHLYMYYEFGLQEYSNSTVIASELQAEISKVLDYLQYSKYYKAYEYLMCSIESTIMQYSDCETYMTKVNEQAI